MLCAHACVVVLVQLFDIDRGIRQVLLEPKVVVVVVAVVVVVIVVNVVVVVLIVVIVVVVFAVL